VARITGQIAETHECQQSVNFGRTAREMPVRPPPAECGLNPPQGRRFYLRLSGRSGVT
jgi:hypothetical protein